MHEKKQREYSPEARELMGLARKANKTETEIARVDELKKIVAAQRREKDRERKAAKVAVAAPKKQPTAESPTEKNTEIEELKKQLAAMTARAEAAERQAAAAEAVREKLTEKLTFLVSRSEKEFFTRIAKEQTGNLNKYFRQLLHELMTQPQQKAE